MEARRLSITDEYELLQIKVFSRWATNALKSREIVINNVTEDFCDGINLCYLAEVLTKKQAHRKIDLRAKLPIQKTMNCDLAIEMFTQDNVKLVGIGGKDIVDGNKKLTLGLIWTLILNYTIAAVQDVEEEPPKVEGEAPQPKKPKKSATQALMSWAVDNTEEYDNITNFRPLPLAMCALLNNYKPDVINFQSLNPRDMEGNAKLAMETCESLGVPLLLDWEDLVTGVDDKTLFTQLSYIKRELKKLPKQVVPKNGMILPVEETAPAVVEPVKISPLDQVLLNWAHLKGLNSEVNDIGLVKTELPNLAINLLKTEDAAADPLKSFIDDGVKLSEDPESLLLSLVVKYSAHPDSPDYNENDEIAKFSIIKPAIFAMADLINSYFPDTFKEADLNREDPNHTADVVEAYCKENNLPLLLDRDMEISPDIEDRAVFVELAALKDALEELKKKQLPPIDLDEKVFNKWANCRIKPLKLPYQFERISTEISDPEKLSDLSTALADGRQPIEKTLPVILDFLHNEEFLKEGTATTPEMLSGDELKPKLDFIWNLIIKFQITAALNQPTYEPLTDYEFDKAPLTFLQNTSKETGVKGLRPLSVAMLTLISLYYPEKVPQINKDNEEEVLNNLFKVCEENDFPILLDREDFANPATGKVTLTQLSLLKSTLAIRKNNDLEKAVFTRWANIYTKDRGITLDDITEDATDPTKLIALVEGLTGKSPNDKTVAGTLDLLHKQDGLKDETTPEQLTGDTSINLPKKLDFLWNLVIRYQITAALKSQNYHPSITPGEFQLSVEEQTGVKGIDPLALALLKIVASYYPDQVDNSKLDPSNHEQLNNYLCEISENNQYPLILTLNDFNSGNITNRVALTQLSLFKNYFYIRQIKETECHALARWANFKVKDRGIEFDLLANDLSNNEKLYVLANELSGKTPSNRTVPGSLELLQREDGLKDSTTAEQLTGKDWNRRVDFLWSLVVRYQITAAMSENNTSSPDYIPEQTPNDYRAKEQENIKIKELRPVPLSMLVLISQFYPEQADPSKVDQSSVDGLLKTLIPLCESNNYPLLLTEEEFKIHLTDRVVLTQLAVLHSFLVAKKIADEEAARKAAEEEAARLAAEEAARLAAEEAARKAAEEAARKAAEEEAARLAAEEAARLAAEEAARKAAEEEAARLAAEEAARLAAEEAARKAAEEEAARLAAEEAARKAAEEEAARLAAEEAARKAAEEEAARLAAEEAARKAAEEEAARKAAEEAARKAAEEEAARLAAEEAARKAAEEAARKAAEEEAARKAAEEAAARKAAEEAAARKAAEEAAARKAAEDAENAKRAAEEAERKAALLLEKNILARWATYTTRYHNVNFNNFSKDIATADKLTILARVLTNKQPAQKGVPGALDHLHKADGLKDDTTPQQINGKDDSLKYNFVWNLIIKYQISAALDDQHNKPDPNYDPSQTPVLFQQKVQKETNSENLRPLQLACLSLIARYMPSKVNLSTIDTSNNEAVLQQLLDTAQANQLPLLLTKEDFGQPITDKVALTQLALLKSGIYLRLNEEFESKVFSRWATIESRKVNITFENIVEEISDAEKFSGLVFALSGKQTQQKTVASTLDLLHKNEGLIDRTSSAHLAGKDFKIKLEFVWGLVIRYLITAALNEKTHKPLPNYKPDQTPVQFFQAMQKKTSVQNLRPLQLALLVLIHYYFPNVVNAATIEELKNADKNRQLEQLAQVCRENKYPLVLDNEDFSKQLSARIILTQVALFNHYLAVRKEEELQAQVFSKWVNLHLQARGIQLDEMDMNQLGQGQNFSVLIELLSQKDVPDKSFKGALGFLRNEKVPYVVQSINPDVDDFNLMDRDVQFDLLYSLIDRYEVQENPQEFKNWCRSEDGSASSGGKYLPYTMAALVAKYHPEAIKLATLDRQNIPATVDVVLPVCNHLGAPLLLSRDEYLSDVSDKVYYTQLAVLKSFFERQLKEQQEARRRLAREVEGKIYCRWANLKLNKSHQQPEESEEAETPAYQVTVPQDFKDDPTKLYILTHKLTASEGSEDVQPTNVDQLNSILRNNNFKGHQISGDQLQSEGDEAIDNFLFDLIVRYTLLEVNGINKEQRKRANYSEEQAIQAFVKWLNANIRNNTEPLSRAIVAILAKYYPQDVKGINPNQTDKAALELCKNLDIPLLIDNEEEFACNPYLSPKAKVAVLASLKDAIESKNRPEEEEPMVVQERGIGLDLDNDEESNRLRPLPTENIESPLLQENLPGDEPLDRVPPRNNNINYLWVIIPLIVIGALLPTVSNLL